VLESKKRKRREELGSKQPRLKTVWHTGLSGGAPDSVRCARLVSSELATLGSFWRHTAIIHRTVRWRTGLSGEPTAASATVGRQIRGRRVARSNGRQGAPDCQVCTGQCPVRQPARRSNGRLRQEWKEIHTGHATVLSGGAPDCLVRHPTEGKNCLPCWVPTTANCLGAIKGTPRRMEESPKHSLIIPKHQDSILAHSIL
jgi:hypothetical protein